MKNPTELGRQHRIFPLPQTSRTFNFPEPGISIRRPSGYTLLMGGGHLSLPNKAAKNKWGLSLVDIRVIPKKPFGPHLDVSWDFVGESENGTEDIWYISIG
jgi:hypothetical protein